MKRWIWMCLLVLLVCSMPLMAMASSVVEQEPVLKFDDRADYITTDELAVLQDAATALYTKTGIVFGIFTVDTLGEQQAEEYLAACTQYQALQTGGELFVAVLTVIDTANVYAYAGNGVEQAMDQAALQDMLNYGIGCITEQGNIAPMYEGFLTYLQESYLAEDVQTIYLEYLIDEADLLTEEEEADIRGQLQKLHDGYGGDYVIVTVESTDGKSAMDYADDYFDYNGYSDNGVLLLVDIGGREWWMSTEGPAIDTFSDETIQYIGGYLAEDLGNEAYYQAFDDYIWELDYYLEQAAYEQEQYPDKKPAGTAEVFLEDGADLLTSAEEELINSRLTAMRELYGQDIVIVTTNDLGGEDVVIYADDYFDYNGYTNDGALLLIDMGSRQWWISTEGTCIWVLTDEEIQSIGKDIVRGLKDETYFEACNNFLRGLDQELRQYFDEPQGVYGESAFGYKIKKWWRGISPVAILVSLVLAVIVALIIVTIMKAGMKTARMQPHAREYIREGSFRLTQQADIFLYSRTTSRYIPPSNHSGSSGGGSSTHRSSSGSRRGGGGGRF